MPKDNSTDYIKRVIGLPGDHIQMNDGLLYINDQPVKPSAWPTGFPPTARERASASSASARRCRTA